MWLGVPELCTVLLGLVKVTEALYYTVAQGFLAVLGLLATAQSKVQCSQKDREGGEIGG